MASKQEIFAVNIEELQSEEKRLAARKELFDTIRKGEDLDDAYKTYTKNEKSLIPKSIDRWAQRTGQDIFVARKTMIGRIFEKDVQYAKHLASQSSPESTPHYPRTLLDDLRRKEHIRTTEIQVTLTKLTS